MADESRKIILQLNIDAGKTITEIVKVKDSIVKLKEEQKNLDLATVEGKKAFEAYNAQIKALTKEQRSLELAVEKTAAGMQYETGSIAANRAELSKLTAEYKNIAKPTADQTKRIKDLSDRLKEQEAAMGNTTRNVGNYREGITQAISGTTLFGGQIGATAQKFTALKGGLNQGATGFKALKGAIAALGIVGFILIIEKLIDYFKSTEKGAELIERALAGVGAVVDTLIVNFDKVIGIGMDVVKVFYQLATFNLDGATKTVEGITDASVQLGKDIAAAADEAVKLKGRLQELEDEETKQSVADAKRRNQVALLIKQSKDRTKSEGERLALLDKASEVERKGAEKEIALAEERFKISQKQLEIDIRNGKVDKENISKDAADAEIAYQNALGQSQEKLAALDARRSAFLLEEQKEREKAIEEQLKLQAQLQDALAANIANERDREIAELNITFSRRLEAIKGNSITERRLREQILIQQRTALGVINKKYDDQELKEREKRFKEFTDAEFKLETSRIQRNISLLDLEISEVGDNANKKILLLRLKAEEEKKLSQAIAEQKLADLTTQGLKENANIEAIELEKTNIIEQAKADREKIERGHQDQITQINIEGDKIRKANEDKASEDRKKKREQEVRQFQEVTNQIAGLFIEANQLQLETALNQNEKARQTELANSSKDQATQEKINKKYDKRAADEKKKAARTDADIKSVTAGINLISGVIAALGSAPPPLNLALAAITAAAGGLQIAKLQTEKGKFAKGGLITIGGNYHSSGGTTFTGTDGTVFEAEKDEVLAVVNRHDAPTLKNLSAVNSVHGKPFYNSIRPPMRGNYLADGGYVQRRNSEGFNEMTIRNIVKETVENMPPIIVRVADITTGVQQKDQTVRRANVTQ